MTLYAGISVSTARSHGTIRRRNLCVTNAHPFLLLREPGARKPETKKSAGITAMSSRAFTMPTRSFVDGSSTSQKEAKRPLLS